MNDELRQLIEDSVNLRRDSIRENELVVQLRKLDAREALEIVKELEMRHAPCSFFVAKRTLNQRQMAVDFFSYALPAATPYTIQFVLDFGLAKLGIRKVINALSSLKTTHPKQFESAMYYLPRMISTEDRLMLNALTGE
jgi:hypothetical protein